VAFGAVLVPPFVAPQGANFMNRFFRPKRFRTDIYH
jgi:hypothetical protein